ncbi:dentin sialophosphoprotein [Planococcus citri]|uniref:dentin sialophosphoprotein n=1 Tax=Planococcus citri TaxID=170843 RepID=UPI0031F7B6C8
MEMSKTECKRILRSLELKAYKSVVDALRAQGGLTANKFEVLMNLAATLKVGEERYRSEIRRAANDDLLNTIAQRTTGKDTEAEWQAESGKKVPLTPMVAPHTAFTVLADAISDIVSLENEKFSESDGSSNVVGSYKFRNDENLKKYQSSKVMDSLLKKRKDHHENSISSELENIKQNTYYHSSPIKSGYIEIAYDESSNSGDTQETNFSYDDTNSSFETPLSPSYDKASPPEKNFESIETSSSSSAKKNDLKLKRKRDEKEINSDRLLNISGIQNTDRTRNLRMKPFKKYTWNSVEIRSFEKEEDDDDMEKITDYKTVNDTRRNPVKSHCESSNVRQFRSRKSDRRNRNRTKFVRQIKIGRIRKHTASSKMKIDATKQVPSRTSRISSRNARRRNYARIASGDYDLLEFENLRKEKKAKDEQNKREDDDNKETDDDTSSDSSTAPIEISYNNPAAPKNSDFDLDGVSGNFTETDDDMKPHTFNLIPASRRLKILKKQATSPSGEEPPAKQIALSSQSNDEPSVAPVARSLLDINALKKVLATHENSENLTSSSLSDASDIADVKETADSSARSQSSCDVTEINECKQPILDLPRLALEKKVTKPKMRLSEASTIENLHSLLSKVKEIDSKRHATKSSYMKNLLLEKKKDPKKSPRSASPIVNNCNGTLIEVGSEGGSVENENSGAQLSKNRASKDQITNGNDVQVNAKSKPTSEPDVKCVSINEEEVVSITLDDLEDPRKCDVTEQLIDIESADIIIGDSGDQNDEFILTDKNSAISVTETKNDPKLDEAVKLSNPLTVPVQNNEITEQKDDVIAVNSKNGENKPLHSDSGSFEIDDNDVKVKSDVPANFRSTMEKILSASADFRYKADADDPSVKQSASKPSPSHLVTATVISGIPTIINSSKKFGNYTITGKATNTIVVNASKIVNSSPKLLANKLNESNSTNNSIFSNDRQFVLLDTKSITGSKSLLKPIKILSKNVISNKVTIDANSTVQKPKMLSIYSSLKNLNEFTSSVNPVTVKSNFVFKGVETKSADAAFSVINDRAVVAKPADEMNPQKLIFSQTLETSSKSVEAAKSQVDKTTTAVAAGNIELSQNIDKVIEISSSDSQDENTTSNDSNFESISSNNVSNEMKKQFFQKILLKNSRDILRK